MDSLSTRLRPPTPSGDYQAANAAEWSNGRSPSLQTSNGNTCLVGLRGSAVDAAMNKILTTMDSAMALAEAMGADIASLPTEHAR